MTATIVDIGRVIAIHIIIRKSRSLWTKIPLLHFVHAFQEVRLDVEGCGSRVFTSLKEAENLAAVVCNSNGGDKGPALFSVGVRVGDDGPGVGAGALPVTDLRVVDNVPDAVAELAADGICKRRCDGALTLCGYQSAESGKEESGVD